MKVKVYASALVSYDHWLTIDVPDDATKEEIEALADESIEDLPVEEWSESKYITWGVDDYVIIEA